jgi:putative flippase GtrA
MSSPAPASTLMRFVVVGLGSTMTHTAVAVGLIHQMGVTPVAANGIAFGLSTVQAYLLNTRWSFGQRPTTANLSRYLVVTAAGFGLTLLLSRLCESAGWSYGWGIAAVVAVVPIFNFSLHRLWTYTLPQDGPVAVAQNLVVVAREEQPSSAKEIS